MKKILFLIACVSLLAGCKNHSDPLYYDRYGKVVSINGESTHTMDKFHQPVSCAYALVQDMKDTTLFVELSSCGERPIIDKEWYYNHRVGDTVHFDYILRSRYFEITPR